MTDEKPRERAGEDAEPKAKKKQDSNRRKRRALIISALAAGGVFQLNGWQVQAHGNRSSHSVAAFQTPLFTADDYVVMRNALTAPKTPETQYLVQANDVLRHLYPRVDSVSLDKIRALRADIEERVRLRSTTRQSLEFLREGDVDAAIAAIEGEGWPDRVLGEYLWVLLDIAYLGRDGNAFTADHLEEFSVLGQAAADYVDQLLDGMPREALSPQEVAAKDRAAEILHNIAAFTVPDQGEVTREQLELGRTSAEKALRLRQELGQAVETARAHWMVGRHYQRIGDLERAEKEFRQARRMAVSEKDEATIAWSNVYLAQLLSGEGPGAREGRVRQLLDEARTLVEQADPSDVSLQFLRLQLEIDPELAKG